MVVAAEVAALALFAVTALYTDISGWLLGATATVLAVVVAVVLAAPLGGLSLGARLSRRLGFWRRRRAAPDQQRTPFDVPTRDGKLIGLCWDGTSILSVVRLGLPVGHLTTLGPRRREDRGLNLGVVARALRQFDIEVASIDIITHGWQTRTSPYLARVYADLIGPLAAVAHQDVLLVMRLNPSRCPDAVASRGGGPTGVLRTAMSATRRLANRMAELSFTATPLTAAEISAVSGELLDGLPFSAAEETWTDIGWPGYRSTVYQLDPAFDTEALAQIWSHAAVSVTTRTSVRNDGSSGEHEVNTLVRYGTTGALSGPPAEALNTLEGNQLPALIATLPFADHQVPVSSGRGTSDQLGAITLAVGGCGQLLGADASGQAVAMNLFGPGIRRVDVWGGLTLIQQIVVRANIIGARILIHTDRPEVWRALVDVVADPAGLWVSAWRMPTQTVLPAFTVCVLDSDTAVENPDVITHIRVHREPATSLTLHDGVDIALHQDAANPRTVTVVGSGLRETITLVSTSDERQLFGARPAVVGST